MSNTRCQNECEAWVRDVWLQERFGKLFFEKNVALRSGGQFKFDAVSEDELILVSISTSRSLMSSGGKGVGKLMKLRSDMMFHMLADAPKQIMVFTESCMYQSVIAERKRGRVPLHLEFMLAELPEALALRLAASRELSSAEVRPS